MTNPGSDCANRTGSPMTDQEFGRRATVSKAGILAVPWRVRPTLRFGGSEEAWRAVRPASPPWMSLTSEARRTRPRRAKDRVASSQTQVAGHCERPWHRCRAINERSSLRRSGASPSASGSLCSRRARPASCANDRLARQKPRRRRAGYDALRDAERAE